MAKARPGDAVWTIGPITRTDLVRYAGASGDFHPLHHDEVFALEAGFPSTFAMGMFQAGIVAGLAVRGRRAQDVRRTRIRFEAQLFPGQYLHCQVVGVADDEDGSEFVVEAVGATDAMFTDVVVRVWITFDQRQTTHEEKEEL